MSSDTMSSSDDEVLKVGIRKPADVTRNCCLHCNLVKIEGSWAKKGRKYCSALCRKAANRKALKAKSTVKGKPFDSMPVVERLSSLRVSNVEENQKLEISSSHWESYLVKPGFVAASVSCFKHVPLYDSWDDIVKGFKVEIENIEWLKYKDHLPKFYWVASVQKVAGYMALLRYEGFESDHGRDFWVHMCTTELHRLGWCALEKKRLVPPEIVEHKYINGTKPSLKNNIKVLTLPPNFALKVKDSLSSRFVVGTKVEVVDKDRISCVRVAVVDKVIGGRLHLKYEGCDDENSFWCHERSPLIHPIGWAQIMDHHLFACQDYARTSLKKALKLEGAYFEPNEATWDMFLPVSNPKSAMEFQVGMKLEAIDPLNLSTICVATVTRVLRNNYLMIGIDGMMAADESDCFCYHASSPCIFPVGFCSSNNIQLTPPQGYEGEFNWREYLKNTKSKAAPVGLFKKEIPDHGFEEGMYLEAVDLMEPRLICIASVTKVVGRLLRIHFDGWEENYDQWCDCESPDLYPVGWCQLVGYQLEPPRSTATEDLAKKKKKPTFYKGNRKRRRRTKGDNVESEKAPPEKFSGPMKKEKLDEFEDVTIISSESDEDQSSVLDFDPNKWSPEDVAQYLQEQLPDCATYARILKNEKIDGPQFLKATKESLFRLKGMKVGPCIKIAKLVSQLTQKRLRSRKLY